MNHLLIGAEFPPAPGGGIGTYMQRIAALLADGGETLHVITRAAAGAPAQERRQDGRLIIHRLAVEPIDAIDHALAAQYRPLVFARRAAELAERLIAQHRIDVIEGCEFEAPLHHLQRRRALGLTPGPAAGAPPILVHLHGASEIVFAADLFDPGTRHNRMAQRLEAASIGWADHILAPSRFYAAQATQLFGLDPDRVSVIPYPTAPAEPAERDAEVWRQGSIVFVGRLERRKGILEWLDAAAALARRVPALRFEFAGGNGLVTEWGTPDAALRAAVADDVRGNFVFHGHLDRAGLRALLARARLAVVPSRWDNLPYVCLEAMGAGLPVLTTACGGMAEVVRHGVDGWIAPDCTALDLRRTAEVALAAGADRLAAMGAAAAARVGAVCDNAETLQRHLALRRRLAFVSGQPAARAAPPALSVARVEPDPAAANLVAAARRRHRRDGGAAYLLCDPGDRPDDGFVAAAGAVLAERSEVGIVSAWMRLSDGGVWAPTDPDLPDQLLDDATAGPMLLRAALFDAGMDAVRDADIPALARWVMTLQAMAQGWRVVCLPQLLGSIAPVAPVGRLVHGGMQRAVHARFPALVTAHAARLIAWAGSPAGMLAAHPLPLRVHRQMLERLLERPWPLARHLLAHRIRRR